MSGKETQCTLYSRLHGPQGALDRCAKSHPPLGFNPQTVQPIAIHYTDYAIPSCTQCDLYENHSRICHKGKKFFPQLGLSSVHSFSHNSPQTFTHLKPGDIRIPLPAGGSGFTCMGVRRFFFGGVTAGISGTGSSSQSGT